MSEKEPKSVFTDDTGTRARALVWVGRGLLAALGLALAAIAFSLVTQVTLPGLDGPVKLPGTGNAGATTDKNVDKPEPSIGPSSAPAASPTAAATSAGGGTGGSGTKTTTVKPVGTTSSHPSTPTPTATPSKGTNRSVKASQAPRAHPTHTPGSGQPTPPGKAK